LIFKYVNNYTAELE